MAPVERDRHRRRSLDRASAGGGFALIELLVAVALYGIVGAALISLIRGQSRYYQRQQAAVTAQQGIRAVHDLMGAEIRLAAGTDLLAAGPDTIAVRADVSRAVVCDSIGPDEGVVFVYDSVAAANLLPGFRGLATSPPGDSTWVYSDGAALSIVETGAVPKSACVGAGATPAAPDDRYRRLSGFLAALAGGTPPPGTLIRSYRRLVFSFAPAAAGTRSLRRNSQELATPFRGAAFGFRLSDGSISPAPPPAGFADVVEVLVTGTAPGTTAAVPGARRFGIGFILRNRIRTP